MKIMVVVGTRPEIIRLSAVIKKLEQFHEVILVHTGQNYDYNLNEVFFRDLELREPDYYLDAATGQINLGHTVGNIIAKTYDLMLETKPDALVILGDTNSCLSAYSAKRLKIPIFHMEAGNRCFDQNVPEEINRRMLDHLCDINLAYSENAKQYLVSEGFTKDTVFITGSPMTEILNNFAEKINSSDVLSRLNLEPSKYFVLSLHREENVDNPEKFHAVCDAINAIAENYQLPIIFSCHPRTKKRIEAKHIEFSPLVKNLAPLGFIDYNALQLHSFCVLSDSGTLAEECSIMHFPGVSVRTSAERPEALEAGTFTLSGGVDKDSLLSAVKIATETNLYKDKILVRDYQDTNTSDKVLKIVSSYTNIVNHRVWGKK